MNTTNSKKQLSSDKLNLKGSFVTIIVYYEPNITVIIQGIVLGHSICDIGFLIGVVGINSRKGWIADSEYFSQHVHEKINVANYPKGFWWAEEHEIVDYKSVQS